MGACHAAFSAARLVDLNMLSVRFLFLLLTIIGYHCAAGAGALCL